MQDIYWLGEIGKLQMSQILHGRHLADSTVALRQPVIPLWRALECNFSTVIFFLVTYPEITVIQLVNIILNYVVVEKTPKKVAST